jgi:hypothetical protein
VSASHRRWAAVITFSALCAACGGGGSPAHRVQATLGTYDDGSGRTGLALLATVRDASGAGPAEPWRVTVRTPEGAEAARFEYPAGGPGSVLARWTPAAAPSEGEWEIVAEGGGETLRAARRSPRAGCRRPRSRSRPTAARSRGPPSRAR